MIIHGYGAFSIYLPRKENRPFFSYGSELDETRV